MFQPKIFGKYLLVDKIGTGGIGDVFKAKVYHENGYKEAIAIKTVRPIFSDESEIIDLFETEAKLSMALNHRNIIKVHETGRIKDQHFIAMEYINGRDLREIIKKTSELNLKFPQEVAIIIIKEICDGMDYVHCKKDESGKDMNIVHRDLSPSNILISQKGDIKIIDFGVAKTESECDVNDAGKFVGKVTYASPEQVSCTKLDNRSDIFSIGIIFYETLAKRNPFEGKTEYETLTNVKEANYFPIEIIDTDIQPELSTILKKALAKKREERYKRASEFANELESYTKNKKIKIDRNELLDFTSELFRENIAVKETKKAFIQYVEFKTDQEGGWIKESALINEATKRTLSVINKSGGIVNQLIGNRVLSIFDINGKTEEVARRVQTTSFMVLNQLDIMNEGLKTKIETRVSMDIGSVTMDKKEQDLCNYVVKGEDVERVLGFLSITPKSNISTGKKIQEFLKHEFQYEFIDNYEFGSTEYEVLKTIDRRKKKRIKDVKFREYLTSYVGRRELMLELLDKVAKLEDGAGGLVSVRGASGIGKSRLIKEFEKRELASGIKSVYVECENKPTNEKTAYFVLIGIITELFNIGKDDSDALIRTKLDAQNLPEHDVLVFGKLLGIEFTENALLYLQGENLEREISRVTRETLINYSKKEHIVIFIDDFNFIDEKSLKFFNLFIPSLNITKILFVVTHDKNQTIFQQDAPVDYSILDIESFTRDESSEFVRNIMPDLFAREDILKKIFAVAKGIPLNLEESIKSIKSLMSEKKISVNDISPTFEIESSLSSLFNEKIKRLDSESKIVLKLASILGKLFPHELCDKAVEVCKKEITGLACTFDEVIENLMREEILQIDLTKGEMCYKFKSDELVEIARKDIEANLLPIFNRATGEAVEELYTDRIEDYYERLAGHYTIARLWAKAFHFSELSGDKLSSRYINDQALTFYESALVILDKRDEIGLKANLIDKKKIVIKQKMGNIYYVTSRWEEGIKIVTDTMAETEKVGDLVLKAQSIHLLGKFQKAMSKWDVALQFFEDGLEIVGKLKDKQLMSDILREIAGIKYFTGKIEQSLIILKEGLRIAEDVASPPLLARYQNDLGMVYSKQGLYEKALASFEASLEYKRKIDDKFGQGITLGNIVDIYYMQLDYKNALNYVLKSLEITKEINDTWGIAVNYHNLGNIYYQLNDDAQAIKSFEHSLKISKELKWEIGVLINEMMLVYLNNSIATTSATIDRLLQFDEQLQKKGLKDYSAKVYYFLGLLHKQYTKQIETSQNYLSKALTLAKEVGSTDIIDRINKISDNL